jgi:hypothetical protein
VDITTKSGDVDILSSTVKGISSGIFNNFIFSDTNYIIPSSVLYISDTVFNTSNLTTLTFDVAIKNIGDRISQTYFMGIIKKQYNFLKRKIGR